MAKRDLARALFRFEWRWLPGTRAAEDAELMAACADLFSSHYGTWGRAGPRPGEPIRVSPDRVRDLLGSDQAHIVCAFDERTLAGYAVILRFDSKDGRRVAWIAQLVVHPTYRRSRVATTLMFSAWQFSDFDAWGIVTANPYAVRALETATRRPCRASAIVDEGRELLGDLRRYMTYLPKDVDHVDGSPSPSVDTDFPVSLDDMEKMRRGAARSERPWNLGSIDEGHEWFAATFSTQEPTLARGEYLDELLEGVDSIWIRAYEGMTLDSDHAWHRHGPAEVDWVVDRAGVGSGSRVLDAGAGDGRHATELAARGYTVTAIEISQRLLERAAKRTEEAGVDVELVCADLRVRDELPQEQFDAAICLYDVVGSSADPSDDRVMLSNLRELVVPGGAIVLSVMSATGTLAGLPDDHRPESEEQFVAALERLKPSRQMERSGSVFDPSYIVMYEDRFYRKEQFDLAEDLPPSELIIRDRRFTSAQITQLVDECGFEVGDVVGVRAGKWLEPLAPDDPDAREIVVVGRAR